MSATTTLAVKAKVKEPNGKKRECIWRCEPDLPAGLVRDRLAATGLTNLKYEGKDVTVDLGEIDSSEYTRWIDAIHKKLFR